MIKSQFFKIILLLIAFGGVLYAMRLLQTPSTSEPISMLLGADLRPLNWCVAKTEKIEIASGKKVFTEAADISRYCEVMIEPVIQSDVEVEDYQVVAIASGEEKSKKLEKNSKGVFRVEGFPFHSKQLEKQFY